MSEFIKLVHQESGEELLMEIAAEMEVEDRVYALLTPAESMVNVLRVVPGETEEDEELEELEPAEFPPLKKAFDEALKAWNCHLEVRADEFLLYGEPPEELFEDCDTFETEDEDEYMILMEVDTGDETYLIAAPIDAPYLPAEIISADSEDEDDYARSLSEEELEKLEKHFHALIEQMREEAEEENENG
ncbi:DUF1292 domain-containing protein [Myxococcota bacterium]|nr:DUF1292 domain-containing protein [Myxococcota bacterium]MBU1432813.1 DUF1292 domain-containing protein [Myxococcota bacterium]MBU1897445.1 DUF1292 domain-containing protein [Myxococcota bacterium]